MTGLHVPGLYSCAVCGFQLVQATLRASDGAIGDRDKPGERCPNDGHLLGRVTWEAHAHEIANRAAEFLMRAVAAEKRALQLEEALQPFAIAAESISDDKLDTDEGRYWLADNRVKINCGTFRRALAARTTPPSVSSI